MHHDPGTTGTMDPAAFEDFALPAVRDAGKLALRHFRVPTAIGNKSSGGGFDPVTEADRGVEALLRARIRARFPAHGIAGEEHGTQAGSGDCTWFIDPIDGTRAFITGMPLWGILLGLRQGARCRLGLMHQPYLDESFLGVDGASFLLRGGSRLPLATAGTGRLGDATLYCTTPDMFRMPAEAAAFAALAQRCRLRRFGGDCYAYCMLAMGCIDLVVEADLQPYDIVPLLPIIEGAGGMVTDWTGQPAYSGGRVLAAANAALHGQALALLRQHCPPAER